MTGVQLLGWEGRRSIGGGGARAALSRLLCYWGRLSVYVGHKDDCVMEDV